MRRAGRASPRRPGAACGAGRGFCAHAGTAHAVWLPRHAPRWPGVSLAGLGAAYGSGAAPVACVSTREPLRARVWARSVPSGESDR